MHSVYLKLSVSLDPKKFDRGAPAGAVLVEALRGFVAAMPGAAVASAAWGLTESESELQELRELKRFVRNLQQQVQDTQELQELRHSVQKLTERLAELEPPVEEPKHEESADVEVSPVQEEPADEPVADEPASEAQPQRRRRVR